MTKDFAIAAIKGEDLGKDNVTDFLTVGFSSTDIIVHYYGPRSVEVEDAYLRLDQDIADFLKALDETVAEDNYLVFLRPTTESRMSPFICRTSESPQDFSSSTS